MVRTQLKNRIHGHRTVENCRTTVTDLSGRAGRAGLATVMRSPAGPVQADLLLELVEALDERIGRLDDRVTLLVRGDPVAQRLPTRPGIGAFGAALLLAEIGTIARFPSAQELGAHAGLTPSTQSSGDKTGHGRVVTSGDELKLVYPQEGTEPERYERFAFDRFSLQPMDGPRVTQNTDLVLRCAAGHPRRRVSLQMHKVVGDSVATVPIEGAASALVAAAITGTSRSPTPPGGQPAGSAVSPGITAYWGAPMQPSPGGTGAATNFGGVRLQAYADGVAGSPEEP